MRRTHSSYFPELKVSTATRPLQRDAIRTQTHSTLSYSTVVNTDSKGTVYSEDSTLTNKAKETRSGTRLTDCAERYMKERSEERGKNIKEVKGCHFCTNWKHLSKLCRMPRKFSCGKKDGASVCGKDDHSSLHGSKSKYRKAMSVNVQTGRRRGSGQSKRDKGQPFKKDACSMVALYLIPVRAPLGGTERCALVMEDPGVTDNFITLTLLKA